MQQMPEDMSGAFTNRAAISVTVRKNVTKAVIGISAAPPSAIAEATAPATPGSFLRAEIFGGGGGKARAERALRRGAVKIRSKSEVTLCAIKSTTPAFVSPNIELPTAPMRNAAPAQFVKGRRELASSAVIRPDLQSSAAATAPEGYPHKNPVKMTVIPAGETPNNVSKNLHFSKRRSMPLFAKSLAAQRKRKREGTTFSMHNRSPLRTDSAVSEGNKTAKNISKSATAKTKNV